MKLNCIIVDDSSVQRMIIAKLVENNSHLSLLGNYASAIEAKGCMSIHSIDVIFLDIEMPVVNGFDFLDGLSVKPQIIFITSKADYAVKAFDYDATDYLQKPISTERFNIAVKRALEMQKFLTESEEEGEFIFIKTKLRKLKVLTGKIKWIEAFGDYVRVITEQDSYLVLSTMKSFEQDLDKKKFMRVHKSYIVNLFKIKRFNSRFAEIGEDKIPLSRGIKEELRVAIASIQ